MTAEDPPPRRYLPGTAPGSPVKAEEIMRKNLLLALTVTFFLGAGTACTGPEGAQGDPGEAGLQGETGEPGLPGKDATPCAVTDNEDGSVTITCGDGTEVTLAGGQEGKPGADGKDGSSCAVTDNEDGTKTVSCDDGTSVTLSNGTDGEDGPQGDPGAQGEPGKDGSSCSVATNEDGAKTITCDDGTSVTLADGADGQPGAQGDPGAQGEPGKDGSSCSATDNGNGTVTIECDDGTSVTISNGKDGQQGPAGDQGPQGEPGEDGLGTLTLPPNGLAGFVRDTANDPVVGATVYLVPANDIPTDPIAVDSIANAIASKVDEPLEDTIALKGAGYAKAVTDMDGIYSIPTVGNGAFFVTVIPAADDSAHLPGGSLCRDAIPKASLVGKRKDITVSTRPSDKATYVGASVCYNCHGIVHEKETLHALGIRVFGQQGPLQDDSRFPDWNKPLKDKFTPTGTTLYFYAYNGNATSPSWKVSETNPGVGVSFTAHMYSNGGKYFVDLANVAGAPKTASYEVGITYGGGLYKQRFITKIGVSRGNALAVAALQRTELVRRVGQADQDPGHLQVLRQQLRRLPLHRRQRHRRRHQRLDRTWRSRCQRGARFRRGRKEGASQHDLRSVPWRRLGALEVRGTGALHRVSRPSDSRTRSDHLRPVPHTRQRIRWRQDRGPAQRRRQDGAGRDQPELLADQLCLQDRRRHVGHELR